MRRRYLYVFFALVMACSGNDPVNPPGNGGAGGSGGSATGGSGGSGGSATGGTGGSATGGTGGGATGGTGGATTPADASVPPPPGPPPRLPDAATPPPPPPPPARVDGGAAPGGACTTNGDCRLFDDYCGGCNCRALSRDQPNPTCATNPVACVVQPCLNKMAACVAGRCEVAPATRR